MVGLELLAEARAVGLKVSVVGDKLLILGPRRADPVAKRLLENKSEVLSVLLATKVTDTDTSPETTQDFDPCVSSRYERRGTDDGWGPLLPGEHLIDPSTLAPCSRCNGLDLWRTATGERRCRSCDPPTRALRLLRQVEDIRRRNSMKTEYRRAIPNQQHCRRCYSTQFTDTRIHGGRSVRRDCDQCGHIAGFPVWFGKVDDRFGTT